MHTSDDHILTTHIGSLPRPPALLERLERRSTGELGADAVREQVRDATEDVVRKQLDHGIDVVNNGEQARTGFHLHATDRLDGFGDPRPAPFWGDVDEFPAFADREFSYPEADSETGAPLRPAVTGPVSYVGEDAARREIDGFLDVMADLGVDATDAFMTAPSPGIVATSLPNAYYDSHREYLFAVADALATEYELVADAGVILQVDAPDLLHTHHRSFPDGRGPRVDSTAAYRELVRTHVRAINEALDGVPADRVRLHTCWGNYEGPHHLDVALEDVLPELYELSVGALAIEQSSPRHQHEYRAFETHPLPDGMVLMPGVIDVKSNVVEHPTVVADRLERAAEVVGDPRRIVATPDCGFGTLAWSAAAADLTWAKLDAMVEGATIASERLY